MLGSGVGAGLANSGFRHGTSSINPSVGGRVPAAMGSDGGGGVEGSGGTCSEASVGTGGVGTAAEENGGVLDGEGGNGGVDGRDGAGFGGSGGTEPLDVESGGSGGTSVLALYSGGSGGKTSLFLRSAPPKLGASSPG